MTDGIYLGVQSVKFLPFIVHVLQA